MKVNYSTYHLRPSAEYSNTVIVVGDPDRARVIAKNYLTDSCLVNENRGLLGFNGYYKNTFISVQSVGMGCPSAAIVIEELLLHGVKNVFRLGTCCFLGKDFGEGVFLVDEVVAFDGTTRAYSSNKEGVFLLKQQDKFLNKLLFKNSRIYKTSLKKIRSVTVDNYYNNNLFDDIALWRGMGASVIDMETSILMYLGKSKGIGVASLLNTSDYLYLTKDGQVKHEFVDSSLLASRFDKLIRLLLETIFMLNKK